ncbi:hypothetical protein J4Q44_G00316820 [Coregonus suidteri]|uniref:Uncharacterized protein n=1 Tax=Coregonus suidteri TaxID=861788 RepID=A0AAN8QR24_9TELE
MAETSVPVYICNKQKSNIVIVGLLDLNTVWSTSRVAQWSKALHRSASCATRDPGSNPGSVVAGRDQETHGAVHNWPSVVQGRGGNGRQGCSSVGRAWRLQRQGCGFDSHGGPV